MLEYLAAFAKLALYAGSLTSAGTVLAWASLRRKAADALVPRGVAAGAGVALAATIAGGLVLLMRLGGDYSLGTISAVFGGPVGIAFALQVVGSGTLLVLANALRLDSALAAAAAIALLLSFGITGHAAGDSWPLGAVAFIHVGIAAWWLGALGLLLDATDRFASAPLAALVSAFSRLAVRVMALMVLAGAVLSVALADASNERWLTPYVGNLSLKILLAATALGLATYNKFRVTPRLASDHAAAARLRRTIVLEIVCIAAVLAATAWLVTFNPPQR